LLSYYDDQLMRFKKNELDAKLTLKVGEYKLNDKLDLNISAALMKTINTIYNLEETITKT